LPIFSKQQNDSFCPLRWRVFRDRIRYKIYLSIGANIVEQPLIIQIRSKDSQVKTQLVLRIFILFKVLRRQYVSASITRPSSGHKQITELKEARHCNS